MIDQNFKRYSEDILKEAFSLQTTFDETELQKLIMESLSVERLETITGKSQIQQGQRFGVTLLGLIKRGGFILFLLCLTLSFLLGLLSGVFLESIILPLIIP